MSIGYFRHPGYDAVDLERVTTDFTTCLLYIHLYILQLICIAIQGGLRADKMDWAIPVQLWMDDNGGNRTLPPGTGPTRESPSTSFGTR
jgi:hypothetical protein